MLRWFFLIVLLLNAVLYGWFYQEQENRRRVAERAEARVHGVADLDLIDEVPASALRFRQAASPPQVAEPSTVVKSERYCFRVGPFPDSQGLERWLADDALGPVELHQVEKHQVEQQQTVITGQSPVETSEVSYQVMVSAPETPTSRRQLVVEMQQLGLVSEWIGAEVGPEALMVAEYSQRGQAQALVQVLTEQGYTVTLQQQAAIEYQYYLLLRTDNKAIADTSWQTTLLQNFPYAKSEKKLCQGLATTTGRE